MSGGALVHRSGPLLVMLDSDDLSRFRISAAVDATGGASVHVVGPRLTVEESLRFKGALLTWLGDVENRAHEAAEARRIAQAVMGAVLLASKADAVLTVDRVQDAILDYWGLS